MGKEVTHTGAKVSPSDSVWNVVKLNNHFSLCASTSVMTQPEEDPQLLYISQGSKTKYFENIVTAQHKENTKAENHWITDIFQVTQDKEKRLQLELAAVISHSVH